MCQEKCITAATPSLGLRIRFGTAGGHGAAPRPDATENRGPAISTFFTGLDGVSPSAMLLGMVGTDEVQRAI